MDDAFRLEPQALQRLAELKPGDRVILTLRAGGKEGRNVVTRIERRASVGPGGAAASGVAGAGSARLPTDTVGPLRDPRAAPATDPRKNPLRDPRVVPGLSEPVPTPTPTPSPR